MNPVDEYLEKFAFAWRGPEGLAERAVKPALQLTAVSAALSAGAYAAEQGLRRGWQALTKKRDFDEMMHTNPGLRALQRQDPKMFAAYYNSLRRLNPRFAADPVVAGTYMNRMVAEPQQAGNVIVESLGGAKNLQSLHKDEQFFAARPIKMPAGPSFSIPKD